MIKIAATLIACASALKLSEDIPDLDALLFAQEDMLDLDALLFAETEGIGPWRTFKGMCRTADDKEWDQWEFNYTGWG